MVDARCTTQLEHYKTSPPPPPPPFLLRLTRCLGFCFFLPFFLGGAFLPALGSAGKLLYMDIYIVMTSEICYSKTLQDVAKIFILQANLAHHARSNGHAYIYLLMLLFHYHLLPEPSTLLFLCSSSRVVRPTCLAVAAPPCNQVGAIHKYLLSIPPFGTIVVALVLVEMLGRSRSHREQESGDLSQTRVAQQS